MTSLKIRHVFISNVRFLTEGIDVPNLDAIVFYHLVNPKSTLYKAVGRIIRKSEGKEYGYIILPIVVPQVRLRKLF